MSTTEYLKGLDYDQLLFARDCADGLIKAKEAEARVPIWVVTTDCANVGAFLEHDYQRAVERAHVAVDMEANSGQGFVIQVEQESRRVSEVPKMLAWNV